MAARESKPANSGGFFQRLLDTFFKSSDPEAEKRRLMKHIAKEVSKTKLKFYKFNTDEVLPAFAKTFFVIYKTHFLSTVCRKKCCEFREWMRENMCFI